MSVQIRRVLHVGLNVADLAASVSFYEGALGFAAGAHGAWDPAVAALLGAAGVQTVRVSRGAQAVELAQFDPPGAPYPAGSHSNDAWFQHCALTTRGIGDAYARLQRFAFTPISRGGPQALPPSTGSVVAFKFRDPDGHPLELIEFPGRGGAPDGIDHTAISVLDTARSIAFYAALGLRVTARGLNTGPAQDALDGLDGTCVDVVALAPPGGSMHLELLGYRTPAGRPGGAGPRDIAASRVVLAASGLATHPGAVTLQDGSLAAFMHDPDGHALLLLDAGG